MSVPIYAWISTAGALALLVGLDLGLWGRGIWSHALRTLGCAVLAILAGGVVFAMLGPHAGANFVTAWTAASVSVLDTAVVLVLLAGMAGSPSRRLLTIAVVLGVAARGASLGVAGEGTLRNGWILAIAGLTLIGMGWRFFARAETGGTGTDPSETDTPSMRRRWRNVALAAGCAAVALFAWTSTHASAGVAPSYLTFVATAIAALALRPLFLLSHELLERGEWSRTGMAVLAAFTGTKLLWEAVLPEEIFFSSRIAVLSVLVLAVVLAGSAALPALRPGSTIRPAGPGPD